MSWAKEKDLDSPHSLAPGSPLLIVGFVAGVLVAGPFAYFWMLAWVIPLLLAGVFTVLAAVAGRRAWWFWHLAEGAAAATVFSVVLAAVAYAAVWFLGR